MASVTDAQPDIETAATEICPCAKTALRERIRAEKRAALVVNTKSRRGQASYKTAKRLLEKRGIALGAAYPVRDPSRFPEIVAQCVGDGYPLVILGGGDGSISASMDSFAGWPVALGLLPLGTANSFARTLGIPLDLARAVDVMIDGKLVDVDLGRINGNCFANGAAVGLPSTIARVVPHGLKKIAGRFGYLMVAAVMLLRHKPFRCTIDFADGRRLDVPEAVEIRIANGAYEGGVLIAREAEVESGDLVVYVVKGRSLLRLAIVWAQLAVGFAPSPAHFVTMRGRRFTVTTDPPHYVSIDGEAVTTTPIEVAVVRQALCLMAPRDRADLS